MNGKQIMGIVAVAVVGAGLVAGIRYLHGSHGSETAAEEDTNTVVTVQTGKIERATLHRYVEGFGVVAPAPAGIDQPAASTKVAPAVAGILSEAKVWEGEQVKKGDLLFQLNSQVAEVAVVFAKKTLQRQKELLRLNNTSQKAVQDAQQQLDAAQAQLELLRVRAPLDGTITRMDVHPGEAVDLTTTLAEITDLSRLTISAGIPAYESSELASGQAVELLTTPPLRTSLSYVSPTVDASNGTVLVRATAPPGAKLRPGQMVQLRVVTEEHTNCLAAPAESVVTGAENQEVISLVTNDVATQVSVKTGLREGALIEVSGAELKAGDVVVTVGAYGLPRQTKIQVAKPGAE